MIPLVASDNRCRPLLAGTPVPDYYDPLHGSVPARLGALFFTGDASFSKTVRAIAMVNLRLLRNYLSARTFFYEGKAKFPILD